MSRVVIKQCDDYRIETLTACLNSGMDELGGWSAFVKPGMQVLLKINLLGPKPPESAVVTHCELVRALARILKSKGCVVWIGDSAGGAIGGVTQTQKAMAISGMEEVASEEGAVIKNFENEGVVSFNTNPDGLDTFYIARPACEADLVINMPKFKTHTMGIYTGAVKNLFGCIPGLKKAAYHREAPDPEQLGTIIARINQAVHPKLVIMDAVTAMQGNGPTAGDPYHAAKILFSNDSLALDTVALRMLDINISDVPVLKASCEMKIGEYDFEKIDISGDFGSAPPKLKNFKVPKRMSGAKKRRFANIAFIKMIDFMNTRPVVNHKKCINCNACVESCPVSAIDMRTKKIDYSICIECMCCHELCMYKAVELKRINRLARLLMHH